MAAISAADLQVLRNAAARNSASIHWTKAQVHAAFQAVQDRLDLAATRTAIGNDIEAAAPGVFNAAEKTRIFYLTVLTLAQRNGVN